MTVLFESSLCVFVYERARELDQGSNAGKMLTIPPMLFHQSKVLLLETAAYLACLGEEFSSGTLRGFKLPSPDQLDPLSPWLFLNKNRNASEIWKTRDMERSSIWHDICKYTYVRPTSR